MKNWFWSLLQNIGVAFFVAGMLILANPAAIGANGILMGTSLIVLGSVSIVASGAIAWIKNLEDK